MDIKKTQSWTFFYLFGNLKKLDDQSTPSIFLGYEKGTKAYKSYNPTLKTIHITRDVVFEEEKS